LKSFSKNGEHIGAVETKFKNVFRIWTTYQESWRLDFYEIKKKNQKSWRLDFDEIKKKTDVLEAGLWWDFKKPGVLEAGL
jgi:hypothetical protein